MKQQVIAILFALTYAHTTLGVFSLEEQAQYHKLVTNLANNTEALYDSHRYNMPQDEALVATLEDVAIQDREKSLVYRLSQQKLDALNSNIEFMEKKQRDYQNKLLTCSTIDGRNKISRLLASYERILTEKKQEIKELSMNCAMYRPESPFYQEIKNTIASLLIEKVLGAQDPDTYAKKTLHQQHIYRQLHEVTPSDSAKKIVNFVIRFRDDIKALGERSRSEASSPANVTRRERPPFRRSQSLPDGVLIALNRRAMALEDSAIPSSSRGLPSATDRHMSPLPEEFSDQQPQNIEALHIQRSNPN